MSPAFGRRTPQKPIPEGRPKRQAVLNRKETKELTKGIDRDDENESKKNTPSSSSKGTKKNEQETKAPKVCLSILVINPSFLNLKFTCT